MCKKRLHGETEMGNGMVRDNSKRVARQQREVATRWQGKTTSQETVAQEMAV